MSPSQQWTTFFAGKRQQRTLVADTQERTKIPVTQVDAVRPNSGTIPDMTRRTSQQQPSPLPPTRPLRERTYNKFRMDLESYQAVYGSDGPQLYLEQTINKTKEDVGLAKEDDGSSNMADALEAALERAKEEYEAGKKCGALVLQDKPQKGMKMHSVRAPGDRGVDGWRAIWTRSKYQSSPCVNDGAGHVPVSKEDKFKYVSINGRKMVLKKNPYDAEFLDKQERRASMRAAAVRRRAEDDGVKGGRQPSRLSRMSAVGEDVEYPTFVQQAARWSAADIGLCTVYEALMAYIGTLTKQYDWKGEIRGQTIEAIRRLRPRADLTVSCESGMEGAYDGVSEEEKARRTEVERSVVQLRIKLKMVAKMYAEAAMTASGDEMDYVNDSTGTKQMQALKRSVTMLLTNVGVCG
ncbi:hypothetical protein RBB50_012750 [Rhinocladiella similis]